MKKKILIIDDSMPILYLLKTMLKEYEIETASDGLAAMSWLAEGNIPDLIISDLQMPNIDGWELAKNLKSSAIFEDIPIIILSGSDEDIIKDKCKAYGIYDYLPKPFDPRQLMEKVNKLFNNNNNIKKNVLEVIIPRVF